MTICVIRSASDTIIENRLAFEIGNGVGIAAGVWSEAIDALAGEIESDLVLLCQL